MENTMCHLLGFSRYSICFN